MDKFQKEYSYEYFTQIFLIMGSVLLAERIQHLFTDPNVRLILGGIFVSIAAILTAHRNSKIEIKKQWIPV